MATGTTTGPTQLRRSGDLEVLAWPVLRAAGADVVVTTRTGGVSTGPYESLNLGLHVGDDPVSVVENRRRAVAAVGATLDDLVLGTQVHGALATVVDAGDAGRGACDTATAVPRTDALVTAARGIVLATLVADCVPIVLVDPHAHVLATVHAGWRGTAAGVAGEAVASMASLGARPARILAGIGPAVSARTYTVGADVADAFTAALGSEARRVLEDAGPGGWLVDLPRANGIQLMAAGVPEEAIHVAPFVTGDGRFYSDRGERPCGRFGLLARLP